MPTSELVTSLGSAKFGRTNSTLLHDTSHAQHRQLVDKITQAYDFHELLGSVPSQDQDDGDNPTNFSTDVGTLIPVRKQSLLRAMTDDGDGGCSNAAARQDHWKKDPSFPFSHTGVGFLSQISHLCYRAEFRQCGNDDCMSMWSKMHTAAPLCDSWPEFRDWAITAMSCQAVMRAPYADIMQPHTHIARAVAGCCMILRECLPSDTLKPGMHDVFHPHIYNFPDEDGITTASRVNIHEVVEVIYWMATAQYHHEIGPGRFGRWGSKLLPNTIAFDSLNTAHEALDILHKEGFCKARVWGLVEVCDRKEADLVEIVSALRRNKNWLRHDKALEVLEDPDHPDDPEALEALEILENPEFHEFLEDLEDIEILGDLDEFEIQLIREAQEAIKALDHRKHQRCVANRCQTDHVDTNSVPLIHKCEDDRKCGKLGDPTTMMKDLRMAVKENTSTAWHFAEVEGSPLLVPDRLSNPGEKYMAVSHVWADGTGGRLDAVNACLFDYFARKARDLGCEAIWWDSISVPSGKEKEKALQTMNLRYSEATVTLVHDSYLLGVDATDPEANESEARCLGIVLSGWYTRMWTAMELAKSKDVRVIFGGSEDPVDLNDILVKGPEECSRAHWMACSSIRRLREPVNDLGDLISVLRPRATSKLLDRTIIALNLAEVPEAFFGSVNDECNMTMQLLKYLGRIPQNCLLHGKPTIKANGAFSWCPGSLDDLPAPTSQTNMKSREAGELISMLRVSTKGVVSGEWWCRDLVQVFSTHNVLPYGTDRPSTVKTELALHNPEKYILLSPAAQAREDASLLVMPLSVTSTSIHCQYIGAVKVVQSTDSETTETEEDKNWHLINISLGGEEGDSELEGSTALSTAHDDQICLLCSKNPRVPEKVEVSQSSDHQTDSYDDPDPMDLDTLSTLVRVQPERESSEVPDHTPSEKHLSQAVQAEKEKSIQYLVNQGINLGQDDLDVLMPNKATVCGLWALGSAMTLSMNFDGLDKAAVVFSKAIELCQELDDTNVGGSSWLLRQLQLNHARVLSMTLVNDGGALRLFNEVLGACGAERTRPSYKTAAEYGKRSFWGAQQGSSRQLRPSNAAYQATTPTPMAVDEDGVMTFSEAWDCTEEGWGRLEWDALTELILSNTEMAKYDEAAALCCQALVNILARDKADVRRRKYLKIILARNEVFSQSEQRSKLVGDLAGTKELAAVRRYKFRIRGVVHSIEEGFEKRSKRYRTALKGLQDELSRDHLLVSLVRLHLGASLALCGELVDAEKHLRRAMKDFRSRLDWYHEHSQAEHSIVAFTQFHLGMTIGQLGTGRKDLELTEEAKELLTSSKDYFAGGTSEWMEAATQWALNKVAPEDAQLDEVPETEG